MTLEAAIARAIEACRPAQEGREDPRVAVARLATVWAEADAFLTDAEAHTLVARLEGLRSGLAAADARW